MDLRPDVKTVAVTRVDGGVTVLRLIETEYCAPTPSERALGAPERRVLVRHDITPERVEEIISKYKWKDWKKHASWRFVDNDYVDEATDRTYRNAWKDAPGRNKPDHDMPKARDIHREILRQKRAASLETLDVEYQRADEAGDQQKKRDIAAQKQKLRDVTSHPRIEAAATVDDLKALTLDELLK